MITINIILILKIIFFIWLASSTIALVIGRLACDYSWNELTMGNIIACFIPVKNTIDALGLIFGMFFSLFYAIRQWFKYER